MANEEVSIKRIGIRFCYIKVVRMEPSTNLLEGTAEATDPFQENVGIQNGKMVTRI